MNRQITLSPSSNLGSRRTQFALRFIKALSRIKTASTSTDSSSMRALQQRGRVIKLAADASMASTVGSRRLWSRAVLFKIKNRARLHALKKNKKTRVGTNDHGLIGRSGELRRLVPGGEAMDFCKLLEETAHYIKCLNTQVEVMQSVFDIYKTS